MKIDEAINWNKRILKIPRIQEQLCDEYNEAIQLGIEALEREKRLREKSPSGSRFRLLPSETEEDK